MAMKDVRDVLDRALYGTDAERQWIEAQRLAGRAARRFGGRWWIVELKGDFSVVPDGSVTERCRFGYAIVARVSPPTDDDRGDQPREIFSESDAGYRARERWARRYDDLNGAPEGDWDR